MKAELRLTVISSKALKCLECQLAFFEQSKRCQSTRRSLTAVDLEGLLRPLSRSSVHALPQTHLDFISKSGCRFEITTINPNPAGEHRNRPAVICPYIVTPRAYIRSYSSVELWFGITIPFVITTRGAFRELGKSPAGCPEHMESVCVSLMMLR